MASETQEQHGVVQRLADRAEIIDLVSRSRMYFDEQRWDELDDVLTPDKARNNHIRESLSRFSATQHVVTNVLVDLEGDTANIRANISAVHVYAEEPTAIWDVNGVYRIRAVRTDAGWRLAETKFELMWDEVRRKDAAGARA